MNSAPTDTHKEPNILAKNMLEIEKSKQPSEATLTLQQRRRAKASTQRLKQFARVDRGKTT